MKIHYFQRYHEKENVATANAMLLLSRLYHHSSDKFFHFLKSEFFSNEFDPEIAFVLQEKHDKCIPDATISQESFKIVVETKMSDWFYSDQLMRHLESFADEKYKVLMTLAPQLMANEKQAAFEQELAKYNKTQSRPVIHINTTFEKLAAAIQDIIDDRDYEMRDMLEDYLDYCNKDGLIVGADSWKYMRVQLAGATFAFNVSENIYYDNAERRFRAHDYLGLYKNKSVRAVGKVCARITAVETPAGMEYEAEFGELTEKRKEAIRRCIADGDAHGYDLCNTKHRYFFVDEFYPTDFKKITSGPAMGSRIFDLTEVLETDKIPNTETLAKVLKEKTWN